MYQRRQETIVIIGAGIISLQTALTLLTSPSPPKLYILASHFPGSLDKHYTSPWAGGQWRTHASPDTPSGKEECEWDLETYWYWDRLVSQERKVLESDNIVNLESGKGGGSKLPTIGPSGIGKLKSRYFWDEVTSEIQGKDANGNGKEKLGNGLWWKSHVQDFRILDRDERPEGTVFGVEWVGFCINVPRYLLYLVEEIEKRGGVRVETTLPTGSLGEMVEGARKVVNDLQVRGGRKEEIDLFINATGLSASEICKDEDVYPTRGQTILVKGELPYTQTRKRKDGITYTIPRPGSGTTVLGGVNEKGNWDTKVNEDQNREIMELAGKLAPELLDERGEFEVLGRQVGLRPGRRGGARVEFERLVGKGGGLVLHCYGHGGAGFQSSIGCARKVERMIREEFGKDGVSSLKAKL